MEAFGIVYIHQKRLKASLSPIKGLILGEIYFLTLQCLDKAFRERILHYLARDRHIDAGTDCLDVSASDDQLDPQLALLPFHQADG
jgi:hypothetical protein